MIDLAAENTAQSGTRIVLILPLLPFPAHG
jgi:hypothetical protein